MKKIYLTGPVAERNVQQLEEFDKVKQLLEGRGFAVKTAIDDLPDGDLRSNPDANKLAMNRRFRALNDSDVVVFLDGYEEDPVSHAEVYQAKNLYALPVYSAVQFLIQQHDDKPTPEPTAEQLAASTNA